MFSMSLGKALKLCALVSVAAATPGISASAADVSQDKLPSSGAAMMKMDPEKMFDMMDADKKGFVTKEEFMKFEQRLFEKWDKNKDGHLSKPEFTDRG